MIPLTLEQDEYNNATICHICDNNFGGNFTVINDEDSRINDSNIDVKDTKIKDPRKNVHDHCHLTG
ncbi:hypothetical protein CHS0354_025441, partial [Potamilus streckersoni]